MNPVLSAILLALSLFVGMLLFIELGRYIGRRRRSAAPEQARAGLGVIEGAVFALIGLLIAFTFSSATERFNTRRHLIVQDANAIGTAYLRLDILKPDDRDPLRNSFRTLVDSRIAIAKFSSNRSAALEEFKRTETIQKEIWDRAIAATSTPEMQQPRILLLPAINDVIDLSAERIAAAEHHLPNTILILLILLLLAGAFLAGHGLAASPSHLWIHSIAFAGILAASVYVIIDLENPRVGLINLDEYDQITIDLRKSMQ